MKEEEMKRQRGTEGKKAQTEVIESDLRLSQTVN